MVSRVLIGRSPVTERGSRKPSSISTDDAGGRAAARLDELPGRDDGAAGGEHVVDHQHPLPRRDARRGAPRGSPRRTPGRRTPRGSRAGSLPALRTGTKPMPSASATGRGEDEAAGLHADDLVDHDVAVVVATGRREGGDDRGEGVVVGEDRRDVLEGHALLRASPGRRR